MSPESSSLRTNASDSSLEDDKLIMAAKDGDEKAYKKIVNKYERPLHFHIRKMVKDAGQVQDLVQEAFTKAFDSLDSYSSSYAFSTWLYRIATNHTIDYMRKKKLQTVSISKPVDTGQGEVKRQITDKNAQADRPVLQKQRKNIVRQAIDELPEKYKKVIEMRHMEEKSYQEISEALERPLGTVKAHIFRAREMLYKKLKDKRGKF